MVVENNEFIFRKRMYDRGRVVEDKGVIRVAEYSSSRCFLEVVEDRSRKTLVLLIQK